jgi:hypothetical protein
MKIKFVSFRFLCAGIYLHCFMITKQVNDASVILGISSFPDDTPTLSLARNVQGRAEPFKPPSSK